MVKVAAFYRFVALPDYQVLQPSVEELGRNLGLLGTILLAEEGINSTLAGTPESVDLFFAHLSKDQRFVNLTIKYSEVEVSPFRRWKVKLKREIVGMGVPSIDPNQLVGTYISPEDWNELISQPDVVLIDCRNSYEFEDGSFQGAIDPRTTEFNEFPDYVKENLTDPDQKVAMFCTGGIRCEKATAYLRQLGHKHVYHLQGGILQYIMDIPKKDSLFQGNCFVFDDRRAVDHDLKPPSSN
ncbi:MAG: rhodanese-related sulfurtransferase [Fimbriimonadaceae bacterium]